MGLLDQVLGAAGNIAGQSTGGNGALATAVLELINHPDVGGIAGLLGKFENGGVGAIFQSWVSSGQNLPISAAQVQQVLGNEHIANLASKLGLSPADVTAQLSQHLPALIDHLTPNGQLPTGNVLVEEGLSLLKGKLFG